MHAVAPQTVIYPDCDGKRMADNTLQAAWIVLLYTNLDALLPDFVAADLLWYPVEGNNVLRMAPDVLVALGRPKGYRGSFKSWVENGAPEVVFEILSPGNRAGEMKKKLAFYDRHGVEEYYVYDPDSFKLEGWQRQQGRLTRLHWMDGWTSPLLGIRFVCKGELQVFRPDGTPFQTLEEVETRAAAERNRAEEAQNRAVEAQNRAEEAQNRAEEAQNRAEEAQNRAERLAARLRALGIDPEAM
jgi:Uma2 family endonuclease